METRETLLTQLNETITQLFDVFQNLSNPYIKVYEVWTAKDILGHLVFWHESFARNVCDLVNEIEPKPLRGKKCDLKQRCYDETKNQELDILIERLEIAQKIIQENILSPKLVLIPYTDSKSYTPEEHLNFVNEHIRMHMGDIKKAAKDRIK